MFTGTLREFQKPAVQKMVERGSVLVAYDMGLGKGNLGSTPVLTPTGWVRADAVRVGDLVIGSNGLPTEILGVFPQGEQDIYRVEFSDGTSARVDEAHLWSVQTANDRVRGGEWRTVSVRQMLDAAPVIHQGKQRARSWVPRVKQSNGNRTMAIPMVQPVQFAVQDHPLPIHPYLLGVVLGDGACSHHGNHVTVEKGEDSLALQALVSKHVSTNVIAKGFSFNVGALAQVGIAGCRSWEKFVPEQYLLASPADRLALLQGLMDTDGYAHPDGGTEYSTTSPMLRDAAIELAQSLGGVASCPPQGRYTTYTHNGEKRVGRQSWRVNVRLPAGVCPFRLDRKAAEYRLPTKYFPSRWIDSIQPDGRGETVCFKVAAGDELYVIKDYLVTHNTVLSIAAVEHLLDTEQVREGLIIAGASLKYQWAKEIAKFTDGAKVLVIDGTPSQRQEQYAIAQRYEYVILTYDTVVNDWQDVRRLGRDFVVLDEAVAIKGFTTKRTRTVKKLSAPFRFALTGQPLENRPEEVFSIMEWVDDEVLGGFEQFDHTFIKRNEWGGVQHYRNLPALHEALSEAMVRKKRTDPDVAAEMPDVVEETIYIRMDPAGRTLYNAIREDLQVELAAAMRGSSWDIMSHYGMGDSGDNNAQRGRIMSRLTCLRMLCVHPELLRISAGKYSDRFVPESDGILAGSEYAYLLQQDGDLDKNLGTPKIKALVEQVELILDEDPRNKVVVFSFFLNMLDLVQAATSHLSKSVIFDGTMSAKAREAAKEKFQTNPKVRLFLSSDAGGVGVDLPQANYLISLDLPWSAGKMDQRNARIIRLSSEWEKVTLLNMLVKGSIEERQYQMLESKRAIASAVVDGAGIDAKGQLQLSLSTLSEFIEESSV